MEASFCFENKDIQKYRVMYNPIINTIGTDMEGEKQNEIKNILIVVKDIEKSKQFYHDLFGLNVVLDNDGNMILTEGLVLQEEKSGRSSLKRNYSREQFLRTVF